MRRTTTWLSELLLLAVPDRRTTRNGRRPLRNGDASSMPRDMVPGPLIRARVGDRIRVHFKNLEPAGRQLAFDAFHGVRYKPSSDGSFVPGISGPDGDVKPGESFTYELEAIEGSAGVWPYHCHREDHMERGMIGPYKVAPARKA